MTTKMEVCALTPQQEKLWSDTRAALLHKLPAFTHIFYSMLDNSGSKHIAIFTKGVPIAGTDGSSVLLNPDTFFKYNLYERVFIVAHEIMHCILNHCIMMHQFSKRGKVAYTDGSTLPYDQMIMNVAADLVINDILIQSGVGGYNKDWLHDVSLGTAKDTALEVYKKIFKNTQGGQGGQGPSGKGFDEHLAPGTSQGKDPSAAAQERNEAKWQTEVAAALSVARAQGKLHASMERALSEVLEPKVDWKDKIQALFARKVGSGSFDWRRPDRRLIVRDIYAPGRSGFGCGTIVVGVDTSGSIGKDELDMFFSEMAGILEDCKPKRLVVVWCDAVVGRVDEVEEPGDLPALRAKGVPGGGGTSFIPVFEHINANQLEPDALVYLTDGQGSFPAGAPSYPVIWGNIYPGATYPFGDVVDVPKQA